MENQEKAYLNQLEFDDDEAEETLSFCNFPLNNDDNSNEPSSYQEEFFEFSNELDTENYPIKPNILFFGKTIHQHEEDDQNRDLFKSASSNKQLEKERCLFKNRSSSARIDSYYSSIYSVSNVQKVNISALTSMSVESRRKMFMFGPVKFMPEMELTSLKQRQGKRDPNATLSHIVASREIAVNGGGGNTGRSSSSSNLSKKWGLLKSLRSRPRLATTLVKSFGCFPIGTGER